MVHFTFSHMLDTNVATNYCSDYCKFIIFISCLEMFGFLLYDLPERFVVKFRVSARAHFQIAIS